LRSIGISLIWLDYELVLYLLTKCGRIPWRWGSGPGSIVLPLILFFIFPGCALFWPGILMLLIKNTDTDK
jgi:hypothetical protein